jgi:ribosomal protein S18 acetylase RimI-like enzyme
MTGPYSIEASENLSPATFPAFVNHFRRDLASTTRVDVTPNLLIRAWLPTDARPTRAMLSSVASDYPGFDSWLTKKFSDPEASKKVVVVDNVIAAFSMWQAKDHRNIKLQTFIVGQSFRGTAIGQHLLYHEIRTWTTDPQIERVHVTVAASKSELIRYFRQFGFRVEGFSPNRYPRVAAELIMAKHFLRTVVTNKSELESVAKVLYERIWGLSEEAGTRFDVSDKDLAVPASFPILKMSVNCSHTTSPRRIVLADAQDQEVIRYDDESLMREFFPLRIHLPRKRYVIVPIYPKWARTMLSTSGPHTPLKLRIDNV